VTAPATEGPACTLPTWFPPIHGVTPGVPPVLVFLKEHLS
jgi:hypothetical protein